MRMVEISGTNVTVSRLTAGTASLHHLVTSRERQRVLAMATHGGVTHFDTAPYYGLGLAEAELGKFLSGSNAQFTVTTKIGIRTILEGCRAGYSVWGYKALGKLVPSLTQARPDWTVEFAERSLVRSLRALRRSYVDFLFLHEPVLSEIPVDQLMEWLQRKKAAGVIREWGIAGIAVRCLEFVRADSALSTVVQTEDSAITSSVGNLMSWPRPPQFTFGHLRKLSPLSGQAQLADAMRVAFTRNANGSVIVSSRRPSRWHDIAIAAADAESRT